MSNNFTSSEDPADEPVVIADLRNQLTEANKRIEEMRNEVEEYKRQNRDLQEENERLKKKLEVLEKQKYATAESEEEPDNSDMDDHTSVEFIVAEEDAGIVKDDKVSDIVFAQEIMSMNKAENNPAIKRTIIQEIKDDYDALQYPGKSHIIKEFMEQRFGGLDIAVL